MRLPRQAGENVVGVTSSNSADVACSAGFVDAPLRLTFLYTLRLGARNGLPLN